jgi:hypothetical protein
MSSLMGRAIALVGLLLAAPAAAQTPASPPRVAIVPGIAVNLDTARVDALSQGLAQALAAELEVDAVGGLEVRRLLPADGVPPDCVTSAECATDVARRTGAAQLLFVVMVDSGGSGTVQIDTTWVEPATGRSAARPAIDLASTADPQATFAASAPLLLPEAKPRPKPSTGSTGSPALGARMTEGKPHHFTTASLVTGGAAVVGLGAGVAFGLSTRSKYRACETAVTCTSGQRDAIRRNGLIADAGFVVAIGAAIATGILYATSAEEPRLVVSPSPDGVAVSAFGRF